MPVISVYDYGVHVYPIDVCMLLELLYVRHANLLSGRLIFSSSVPSRLIASRMIASQLAHCCDAVSQPAWMYTVKCKVIESEA